MPRPVYRLIDHTADMAFEVEGPSWAALLENATAALSDVILAAGEADRPEETAEEVGLEVEGSDREDVLVAWLGAVVVRFEEDGFLARAARVGRADAARAGGVLRGRRLDPAREPPDRVVKAVTYHDLRVVEGDAARPWRVAVVLDL
jgi:SHS2 domain-containing protein